MDITDYKLLKWKCIKGQYLYLIETPLPTIAGTAIVAAMIARSCWNANNTTLPKLGLSLIL